MQVKDSYRRPREFPDASQFWKQDREEPETRFGTMANEGIISRIVIPFFAVICALILENAIDFIRAVGPIGLIVFAIGIFLKTLVLWIGGEGTHVPVDHVPSAMNASLRAVVLIVIILIIVFIFMIIWEFLRREDEYQRNLSRRQRDCAECIFVICFLPAILFGIIVIIILIILFIFVYIFS